MLQVDGELELKEKKNVWKKENEIFSLGNRLTSDSLLRALIKCAQLAPSHYYTMSIDFGLESWPDKMV